VNRALVFALSLGIVAACAGGSGSSPSAIQVRRSTVSVAGGTSIVLSGTHLAFLADEATTGPGGTDMNGDGDKTDSIAVVIDMNTGVETRLDVAATGIAWAGPELYLVVDEALDGRDWNGDTDTTDLVLLHVSAAAPTQAPDFIDELQSGATIPLVSSGTRVYFASATAATQPFESSLFAISSGAPTTPVRVATRDAAGPLAPRILAKDEGLLFLALDETVEGRDLNGDGDATDDSVLALLDATAGGRTIRSMELAVPAASPFRARRSPAHGWEVGFLVSEFGQGQTNLNDPALFTGAWQPTQCAGFEDTDARDSILHYLEFSAWDANPLASPPVNTGLVGCRKIVFANGYVATISPEHDVADPNGAEGDCDLNGDGDTLDYVVRWAPMTTPVLPLTASATIHALKDVAGGTHGLSELEDRFVIEVSEAQDNLDINLDGAKTFDYLGSLLPSGNANSITPWDFTHGPTYTNAFGASWLTEIPDRSRLGVAVEERSYGPLGSPGANLDAHDPPLPGEDLDMLDSIPSFARFETNPTFLDFPAVGVGLKHDDAGIVIANDIAFYRVSEAEDSRDKNNDGLETGFILYRTYFAIGESNAMGVLNSIPGRSAIEVNPEEAHPLAAAFIADERLQGFSGADYNGDGDATDLVVSYFLF
jgi:hypothetical protein